MSERPLTDDEIIDIRRIIEHDKRAVWLWSSIRNIAVWVVAVIGGISLAYQSLADAVKHLVGK